MLTQIRLYQILHYCGYGMVAWFPAVLVAWIFQNLPTMKGTVASLIAFIFAVLCAIAFAQRFFEPGYRIFALFSGYLLVKMVVVLAEKI